MIVTSHRRLSRQLQRAYDHALSSSGTRVWESPDILPLDAWLRRAWNDVAAQDPITTPVLLNRFQEDVLWRRAIRESPATDEGASDLLDIAATASAAARAWDLLHAWQLPLDASAFDESADTAAFLAWATFIRSALRENGWITSSQLAPALAERWKPDGPIEYAGFHDITPRDRSLLRAIGATEKAVVNTAAPSLRMAASVDQSAELEQAAQWARANLLNSKSSVSIGIGIAGLAQQRAAAERIFDDVLYPGLEFAPREGRPVFHISAGIPANDNSLIATALLVLGLQTGLPLAEAGALLRSPFLTLDAVGGAKLDAQLRRRRLQFVRFDDLRSHLPQWNWTHEVPHSARPSEWSALFSKLVTASGWPGARSRHHGENEAIEFWKELLSSLASLDIVLPSLSYDAAFAQLRSIAHRSRLREDPGDDAPVQVLDLEEAADSLPGLRFNALWVAGLHSGAWPNPARPVPFLPLELQHAAGIPQSSAERECKRARQITRLLEIAAPEVVFSCPQIAGEEQLRMSPLIEKHLPDMLPDMKKGESVLLQIAESAALLEMGSAEAPPLPAGTEIPGGARLLEDQAACPFRAFAVHRLGARELDEWEIGVSPRERGGAVHHALEWIWKELKTQDALLNLDRHALRELIETAAEKGLHNSHAPERFQRLEHRRLTELLTEWLETEKQRRPFAVVESESDHKAVLGGLILNIRPDRVDRYSDGSHAILDYKTSKDLDAKQWDGERPAAPQLPLYAVKGGYNVSEVMFAKLTAADVKSIARSGRELIESIPAWAGVLETLAGEFVAGRAAVDPHRGAKTCEFCRLPALCRVAELGYPMADPKNEDA